MRHYEDAAHIIRSLDRVPAIEQSARDLADDMLREKDIAASPRGDEPALLLAEADRRVEVVRAFERISPMFWGDRTPLGEACATIVQWIRENLG